MNGSYIFIMFYILAGSWFAHCCHKTFL